MKQIPRRRWLAVALTALLAIGAASTATACDPVSRDWAWKAGKTHGAIIETTAGRASLGIYRVPTDLLYKAQQKSGVGAVQALIWHFGQPPELRQTFSFRGRSVTLSFGAGTKALRSVAHHVIYDDPNDLRGALNDAHRARSCLAVTLISYGQITRNWTQKQVGCQNGAV